MRVQLYKLLSREYLYQKFYNMGTHSLIMVLYWIIYDYIYYKAGVHQIIGVPLSSLVGWVSYKLMWSI